MTRMALLIVAAAGCATDADRAGDAAMNTSAEVTLTRTVCRGVTSVQTERPRCDVPGIGPDNPPMITCWREINGLWHVLPAQGIELVAGAVYCSSTFQGESWSVVVLSSSR